VRENPDLFRESVYALAGTEDHGDGIDVTLRLTVHAHHLYAIHHPNAIGAALRELDGVALVRTADNFLIVGDIAGTRRTPAAFREWPAGLIGRTVCRTEPWTFEGLGCASCPKNLASRTRTVF
jgi:hypothetical protein